VARWARERLPFETLKSLEATTSTTTPRVIDVGASSKTKRDLVYSLLLPRIADFATPMAQGRKAFDESQSPNLRSSVLAIS
jgi:hypothetical protein